MVAFVPWGIKDGSAVHREKVQGAFVSADNLGLRGALLTERIHSFRPDKHTVSYLEGVRKRGGNKPPQRAS